MRDQKEETACSAQGSCLPAAGLEYLQPSWIRNSHQSLRLACLVSIFGVLVHGGSGSSMVKFLVEGDGQAQARR
jgi:hypothetical protein